VSAIALQLQATRTRIAEAAATSARPADAVQLIAVSKTFSAEAVREAHAAGQRHFGENRVQELTAKADALADLPDLCWHLIGPLQSNKAKYLAGRTYRLHTLDSIKLMEELNRQAHRADAHFDCLIQLNISDEAQKSGTDEAGAEAILRALPEHPRVRVHGLMGLAAYVDDEAVVSGQFARLAQAANTLAQRTSHPLPELSMGMSGDFALAIAQGATWVRIGSAIFGTR
jgi:PLP dependent protein